MDVNFTKKEIIRILDNYKIGTLASYKAIEGGEVNYNWIVKTTEGKYILRKESSLKIVISEEHI